MRNGMGDLVIDVCSHPWHWVPWALWIFVEHGVWSLWRRQMKRADGCLRSAPCQQQPTDSSACTDTLICPQCSTDLLYFIYAKKFNERDCQSLESENCSFLFLSSRCPVPIQRGASQPWWRQQRLCYNWRWNMLFQYYAFLFLISWDIFIKTNIEVEDLFCKIDPGKTFTGFFLIIIIFYHK